MGLLMEGGNGELERREGRREKETEPFGFSFFLFLLVYFLSHLLSVIFIFFGFSRTFFYFLFFILNLLVLLILFFHLMEKFGCQRKESE